MADFNNHWIEVFRVGDYGDKGKYGREDLDKIVANYDAAVHEAPLVIGHPELDSPAYGWISALRRSGDALEAQAKQVDAGFEEMLKQGKFKQRSVALYNDLQGRGLYLRHLGFLGAAPPEVKGLKSIFHDADSKGFVEMESNEEEIMDEASIKKTFIEALREFAESMGLVKKPGTSAAVETPPVKTFSEAELTAAKATAAAEAKAAAETKFAEEQAKATANAGRMTKVREFVERMKPLGKWIPAFDKSGVRAFAESLSADVMIEFGEEGKKEKKSPLDLFLGFIEGLPAHVKFGELAAGKDAPKARPTPQVRGGIVVDPHSVILLDRVNALRKENPKLTFEEASGQARQELGDREQVA